MPFPSLSNTTLTLPVPGLVDDIISVATDGAITDDSSVIRLDHVFEEKFERCGNVRFISFGLYEPLPDHRVRFCITLLPHDDVNGLKQRRMPTDHGRVNEDDTV